MRNFENPPKFRNDEPLYLRPSALQAPPRSHKVQSITIDLQCPVHSNATPHFVIECFSFPIPNMSHLLAESSSCLDADRVKWTVPLRLQSNGEPLSCRPCTPPLYSFLMSRCRAGKSYYDEVSVTMTGVPDERTSGAGGMLCADGKTAVVSEPDK